MEQDASGTTQAAYVNQGPSIYHSCARLLRPGPHRHLPPQRLGSGVSQHWSDHQSTLRCVRVLNAETPDCNRARRAEPVPILSKDACLLPLALRLTTKGSICQPHTERPRVWSNELSVMSKLTERSYFGQRTDMDVFRPTLRSLHSAPKPPQDKRTRPANSRDGRKSSMSHSHRSVRALLSECQSHMPRCGQPT